MNENSDIFGRMPVYQSHKQVRAARILKVGRNVLLHIDLPAEGASDAMLLDIGGGVWVDAEPNMFARYRPVPGDYYVVYDYGTPKQYASISPAQQFDDGYALIAGTVG